MSLSRRQDTGPLINALLAVEGQLTTRESLSATSALPQAANSNSPAAIRLAMGFCTVCLPVDHPFPDARRTDEATHRPSTRPRAEHRSVDAPPIRFLAAPRRTHRNSTLRPNAPPISAHMREPRLGDELPILPVPGRLLRSRDQHRCCRSVRADVIMWCVGAGLSRRRLGGHRACELPMCAYRLRRVRWRLVRC